MKPRTERAWRKLATGGWRRIFPKQREPVEPEPDRVVYGPATADESLAGFLKGQSDVSVVEVAGVLFPGQELNHGLKMRIGRLLRLAGFVAYRETDRQARAHGRSKRLERWERMSDAVKRRM